MSSSYIHPTHLICTMCDTKLTEGIMRDCLPYCNTKCYDKAVAIATAFHGSSSAAASAHASSHAPAAPSTSTVTAAPAPAVGGTCMSCTNKYTSNVRGSIHKDGNFFCGSTCEQMYNTRNNYNVPMHTTSFLGPSTLRTIYPIYVDSRGGKLYF